MNLNQLKKNIKSNMSIYEKAKLISQYEGYKTLKEVCKIFSTNGERLRELVINEYAKVEIAKIKEKGLTLSISKFIKLRDKAEEILKSFYTGYSMGEYKYLTITNKKGVELYTFEIDNTFTYRGAWKPKHGDFSISMKLKELEKIERVGRKWIVDTKKVKKYIAEYGYKGSYYIKFKECE
ncbi:MAG: hypothetical protein AB7U51_11760 [Arcobacter sp.]|uniref:hypothetical protein n=1 Tax=Arcobacter sp. TaxID=1872629 RepID=UPI003CFEA364